MNKIVKTILYKKAQKCIIDNVGFNKHCLYCTCRDFVSTNNVCITILNMQNNRILFKTKYIIK